VFTGAGQDWRSDYPLYPFRLPKTLEGSNGAVASAPLLKHMSLASWLDLRFFYGHADTVPEYYCTFQYLGTATTREVLAGA
jgi:hypothetical protein